MEFEYNREVIIRINTFCFPFLIYCLKSWRLLWCCSSLYTFCILANCKIKQPCSASFSLPNSGASVPPSLTLLHCSHSPAWISLRLSSHLVSSHLSNCTFSISIRGSSSLAPPPPHSPGSLKDLLTLCCSLATLYLFMCIPLFLSWKTSKSGLQIISNQKIH